MDLQRIITAEEAYLIGSSQQQARPLDALLSDISGAAYEYRGFTISAHMLAVLRGYISHGIRPGPALIPKLAGIFNMEPERFARELEKARRETVTAGA